MVRNRAPYCFKLLELAVPNLPFVKIMQNSFEDLTSLDDNKSSDAWREFFFNEMAVAAFLQQAAPERVQAVLMAGKAWTGTGCCQSRTSPHRVGAGVHPLSGVSTRLSLQHRPER